MHILQDVEPTKNFMTKRNKRIIFFTLALLLAIIGVFCVEQYYRLNVSNLHSLDGEHHSYKIYPESSLDSVMTLIGTDYSIASQWAFDFHAEKMDFTTPQPGFYRFPAMMGDRYFIRRLQLGEQTPMKLTFNHYIRTREQLAGKLASSLLLDSIDILRRLESDEYMAQFGLNKETSICLFIPNTYEVYWTISPDQLFERMYKEYNRFWNERRRHKADSIGLTPVEVAIVASIVEGETHNKEELPIVASLYLNRVHKGMLLQSCPTVIYANGDFTLRRVLKRHLAIDSPYNTYKYPGLPPGPIRCAAPATIDVVLNAPATDYLYMCANPDFSGTHIFSSKYSQHAAAAVEYRHQLDERQIK